MVCKYLSDCYFCLCRTISIEFFSGSTTKNHSHISSHRWMWMDRHLISFLYFWFIFYTSFEYLSTNLIRRLAVKLHANLPRTRDSEAQLFIWLHQSWSWSYLFSTWSQRKYLGMLHYITKRRLVSRLDQSVRLRVTQIRTYQEDGCSSAAASANIFLRVRCGSYSIAAGSSGEAIVGEIW